MPCRKPPSPGDPGCLVGLHARRLFARLGGSVELSGGANAKAALEGIAGVEHVLTHAGDEGPPADPGRHVENTAALLGLHRLAGEIGAERPILLEGLA